MDADYQMEPELRTSLRRACWTRAALGSGKVFLGLLLAILLIGGFFASRDVSDLYALQRYGRETSARVILKHEAFSKTTAYYLDYIFQGGDQWINDRDDVPLSVYISTKEGGSLDVTYLPSAPSVHRLGRVDRRRFLKSILDWTLGVGSIVVLLLLTGCPTGYDYWRQMRLAASGVPIVGRITACNPPASGSKISYYTVTYTFTDLRGETRTAPWNAPASQGRQLQKGQQVTVLCDPQNPKRFCLYMGLNAAYVEGMSPLPT